jgi:hypothetical protein
MPGSVAPCSGKDGSGTPQLASGQFQALEGLRAGHFMHQMTVDIDQRGAVGFLPHHVCAPELVVKGLRFHVIFSCGYQLFRARDYATTDEAWHMPRNRNRAKSGAPQKNILAGRHACGQDVSPAKP